MSDDALKRRLTDFICEVPMPRFFTSNGVVNIVADDLAGWLKLFVDDETEQLRAQLAAAGPVVAAAQAVAEQWESADWDRGDITDLHNQDVLLDKLSAAVREMGEQQ